MKWFAAFSCVFMASVAHANTVAIASGEHDDFSRLVLTLPADSDWQLGRTATGYELTLGLNDPRYDVSKVFDLIPRDRLSGIFTDPQTGNLQLNVPCLCHAMPFSLDNRTVVIDLRDGAAPPTSSFELTLQGETLPPLQAKDRPHPRARQVPPAVAGQSYDWLSSPAAVVPSAPPALPFLQTENLDAQKQAVVQQLAAAATQGVVDLALPPVTQSDLTPIPLSDTSQLRLTSEPGLRVASQRAAPGAMQADGETCISDERLNIAAWGVVADVSGQLARARSGLVGEFDAPRADAVADHARLYLFLGFGVETTALLSAMSSAHADVPLWHAMAKLMDGGQVPTPHFTGMAQCDTYAALWALLAAPPDRLETPNMPAVQRAFSALPGHLRRQLGPQVTDRLLALDQPQAVQGIVVAMGRGADVPDVDTLLAEADLDLHVGAADAALAKAESALTEGGFSTTAALIAVVRAKMAAGEAIDPATAVALEALQNEYVEDAIAADLAEAHQLALIGSGQFAAAMSQNGEAPLPEIWQVIADRANDDDLLRFAFVAPQTLVPAPAAEKIAMRLQALGFPDAASGWRAALVLPAPKMPIADDAATSEAERSQRWQQDWSVVAAGDDGPWADLAAQMTSTPTPQDTTMPLAAATRLVDESKTTRDLIGELLQSLPQTGG
jgi:hypothetical protein